MRGIAAFSLALAVTCVTGSTVKPNQFRSRPELTATPALWTAGP